MLCPICSHVDLIVGVGCCVTLIVGDLLIDCSLDVVGEKHVTVVELPYDSLNLDVVPRVYTPHDVDVYWWLFPLIVAVNYGRCC